MRSGKTACAITISTTVSIWEKERKVHIESMTARWGFVGQMEYAWSARLSSGRHPRFASSKRAERRIAVLEPGTLTVKAEN
jgi:hypothetical protein